MEPLMLMRGIADVSKKGSRSYYFGIDLGTTNSAISVFDVTALLRGQMPVQAIGIAQPTESGDHIGPLFPSVVFCAPGGTILSGAGARIYRARPAVRGRNIFYSAKSEMGLGREPFYVDAAHPSLDTPYKVSAHILKALRDAAEEAYGVGITDRVVITVPASFQSPQRVDTLRAAQLAGFHLDETGLIDEPNAALLDFLLSEPDHGLALEYPTRILVFDFGGGTCDISILEVMVESEAPPTLRVRNLAISRYERLGGDDIDRAIAYDVLLPKWLDENGLEPLDFSYSEKQHRILPQLTFHAQQLKESLCGELSLQEELHGWDAVDLTHLEASQPPADIAVDRNRRYFLEELRLAGQAFAELMAPFLDPDRLRPTEDEYVRRTSIFAPVQDALEKADLGPGDIEAVLPVGGSSANPMVVQALRGYFPSSEILQFKHRMQNQLCVARGAALHAYFRFEHGIALIRPITSEPIGLLTRGEVFRPLIPAGTEVPFPPDASWKSFSEFVVPEDWMDRVEVVLCSDRAEKVLEKATLSFPTPIARGTPLHVAARMDGHKVLHLRAALRDDPNVHVHMQVENPLASTAVSRNQRHILELEQAITQARVAGKLSDMHWEMSRLAWLYREEGHYEKALQMIRSAMKHCPWENGGYENTLAAVYNDLQKLDEAERHYQRAMELDEDGAYLPYNLGLLYEKQGKKEAARTMFEAALEREPDYGPALIRLGDLVREDGNEPRAQDYYRKAQEAISRSAQDEPEKTRWLLWIAQRMGDRTRAEELAKTLQRLRWTSDIEFDASRLIGITEAVEGGRS